MQTIYIVRLKKETQQSDYHWRAVSFITEVMAESKEEAFDIAGEEYPDCMIVSVKHWSKSLNGEYL